MIMLASVFAEGLRGFHQGVIGDLSPLTVLVGPNGSGKSTILDAVYIALHRSPSMAIVRTIARRRGLKLGARWLLNRGSQNSSIRIRLDDGRALRLDIQYDPLEGSDITKWASHGGYHWQVTSDDGDAKGSVSLHQDKNASRPALLHLPSETRNSGLGVDATLFDPFDETASFPLDELVSSGVERGVHDEVVDIVAEVVPGLRDIRILTEKGVPVVHLAFDDGSVPVALSGDGIDALVRLGYGLTSRSSGVMLLEEPEIHQHPGSMVRVAQFIAQAVNRGAQVILTTHSLEFIDALIEEMPEGKETAVFRMLLNNGTLKSNRFAGDDLVDGRGLWERDLR